MLLSLLAFTHFTGTHVQIWTQQRRRKRCLRQQFACSTQFTGTHGQILTQRSDVSAAFTRVPSASSVTFHTSVPGGMETVADLDSSRTGASSARNGASSVARYQQVRLYVCPHKAMCPHTSAVLYARTGVSPRRPLVFECVTGGGGPLQSRHPSTMRPLVFECMTAGGVCVCGGGLCMSFRDVFLALCAHPLAKASRQIWQDGPTLRCDMCVYVYTYIYICYTYIYIYTHIYTRIYIYIHMYIL